MFPHEQLLVSQSSGMQDSMQESCCTCTEVGRALQLHPDFFVVLLVLTNGQAVLHTMVPAHAL
jgi:hypothetical protein